jgi:hypothetical protein
MYLTLSLAASIINEIIAQILALRAKTLEDGLVRLLHGQLSDQAAKDLSTALASLRKTAQVPENADPLVKVLGHPVIAGLSSKDGRLSYIPSRQFSAALIDVLLPGVSPAQADYLPQVRAAIDKLPEQHLKTVLRTFVDQSNDDVQKFRTNVENWFNDGMDRVSGWYKRTSSKILLIIGLFMAIAVNADTLGVAHTLWVSPATRTAVVAAAQNYVNKAPTPSQPADSKTPLEPQASNLASNLTTLETAQLPIGWVSVPSTPVEWLREIAGLILTALLVSLGAPFWFDLLSKFMQVRASGPVSSESGANDTSRRK